MIRHYNIKILHTHLSFKGTNKNVQLNYSVTWKSVNFEILYRLLTYEKYQYVYNATRWYTSVNERCISYNFAILHGITPGVVGLGRMGFVKNRILNVRKGTKTIDKNLSFEIFLGWYKLAFLEIRTFKRRMTLKVRNGMIINRSIGVKALKICMKITLRIGYKIRMDFRNMF